MKEGNLRVSMTFYVILKAKNNIVKHQELQIAYSGGGVGGGMEGGGVGGGVVGVAWWKTTVVYVMMLCPAAFGIALYTNLYKLSNIHMHKNIRREMLHSETALASAIPIWTSVRLKS